jgi:hypothetical protein
MKLRSRKRREAVSVDSLLPEFDESGRHVVANALAAVHELHTEVQCRSIDGKGREEKPPVDLLFTRKSAPRKHERH